MRKIDALVAEKVMGWRRLSWREYQPHASIGGKPESRTDLTYAWHDSKGEIAAYAEDCDDYYSPEPAWSPSTDIAVAMQVLDDYVGSCYYELNNGRGHTEWAGHWCRITMHHGSFEAYERTRELAICVCALRAAGVPEAKIQAAMEDKP